MPTGELSGESHPYWAHMQSEWSQYSIVILVLKNNNHPPKYHLLTHHYTRSSNHAPSQSPLQDEVRGWLLKNVGWEKMPQAQRMRQGQYTELVNFQLFTDYAPYFWLPLDGSAGDCINKNKQISLLCVSVWTRPYMKRLGISNNEFSAALLNYHATMV